MTHPFQWVAPKKNGNIKKENQSLPLNKKTVFTAIEIYKTL